MKKSIALILAVAMLMIACVACGGDTVDKNLPADETRLQQGSMFTVQGGEIVKVLMQGKKTEGGYYVYTKEAGKSSMADGQSNPLTSVLAGQFQSCVDAVAKAAKAGDMTLGESADFTLTAQLKAGYDKLTKSGADYTYFVYAIEAKTLTKGDGDYEGATTLGLIEYKLADGATAYIAIDR
ncbi:MAG: hypothetical protein IKT90_01085 [Clostridia bacterium]|nr:hypothetical protein [Clostridia bacterium]